MKRISFRINVPDSALHQAAFNERLKARGLLNSLTGALRRIAPPIAAPKTVSIVCLKRHAGS
jgi:hypothetical protein